ncbi:hypothetical protein ClosIBUN13A_CONTIG94g01257 [Clostridium sp. IBUN13A]|nr:hypothetical protein ClosIBUN13A_CONTIG94g01257 [Clostridium sp. IBUN13A]KJZ87252.1 hypothetical protein ClosIBUN22A_CONTIG56g01109 [Clostridium sp. IBUN22A]KJZ92863.1 hypothetical protein ClosIBUN62F_CONTIG51g01763 [Clostridium sp. IBUN62F]
MHSEKDNDVGFRTRVRHPSPPPQNLRKSFYWIFVGLFLLKYFLYTRQMCKKGCFMIK